jgi:tRNA1(Val) A37 N6-methylase TrmN6
VLNDVPLLIKQQSLTQEDAITKKLYGDYSFFKNTLYKSIVDLNSQYDKLELFKKTQKLLDRFLFILFAEDRLLLPPNFMIRIVEDWKHLEKLRNKQFLYERFKLYFNDLLNGNKEEDIFAYNGGLFEPDEVLDNLIVNDQILVTGMLKLSNYDYNTEVDVNILGHIFEHSLNEIEELQASLTATTINKTKTRRKKEGVFYTPRYITKYIVENTVGALCREKKIALEIIEEDYAPGRKKTDKKALLQKLDDYREWLLQLTICDPACGSGAFLNAALEFLIAEHNYVDELTNKLMGGSLGFRWTPNDILEHNLFGVDINEEAVEIARLSLWLRTAQKGRKLSNLSNNIKCGNSLIDDFAVAGDKAFNWKEEFKEVFAIGGFDMVIGNPPYGAKFSDVEKEYVKNRFPISTEGKIDSFRIFFEKGMELLNANSLLSYITPNTFLYNVQSKPLRNLILSHLTIKDAVELRKNIFEDAPDVVTVILTLSKVTNKKFRFRARVAFHDKKYRDINTDEWAIDQILSSDDLLKDDEMKINLRSNKNFSVIKEKIVAHSPLENFFQLKQGTKPYGIKDNKEVDLLSTIKHDNTWEKAINGRNIGRYFINYENEYVQRNDRLHSVLPLEIIQGEKIYFQRMRKISLFPRIVSCYDYNTFHGLYTCSVIYKKTDDLSLKYLQCILNSYLINIWYKYFDTDIEIKLASVKKIPIPKISNVNQQPFITKADIMLSKNKELQEKKQGLLQLLQAKHEGLLINKKLTNWPALSFKDFLKELEKQKIKFSLPEQNEWLNYFETEKQKASQIKNLIDQTDKEIDQMVYALYGLNEEEVKIVENQ